jgi:hypothetical protein
MSTASPPVPVIVQIGAQSSAPFPMIDRIWDIFGKKGIRTVFVSIGNSSSSAADLELAEGVGCPIHAVPLSQTGRSAWEEVTACLQAKKREGANAAHSFSEGAERKWILPKNIRIQDALPFWADGHIQTGEYNLATAPVQAWVEKACAAMKVAEEGGRIDCLKIDAVAEWPGLERSVLPAVLDAGYRPGIVLVNWSAAPDVDLRTTIAAGHLQNAGYRLLAKEGTKFLYYFSDNDLYQICSWEDTTSLNPLLSELARQLRPGVAGAPAPAPAPAEVPAPDQNAATPNASA